MADMAASVLARLQNKAAESGRSNRLCLQLFCQEEFLRRLEKSKYAENLVLKGGLFIYSLTKFDSRVTVDVDFLLRKIPNTPEQLKVILEEIIATDTGNDFISFEIRSVAPIAVAKKYAGVGTSLVAKIKNTRTPKDDLTKALADVLDVSPLALSVPDIDSQLGLMHTLFALEDLYGLKTNIADGEVTLRFDVSNVSDPSFFEMVTAWAEQAAKYKSGEISKEEYDKWRYRFPEFDTTQIWGKVPSKELSDALVDAFKDKLKD